MERLTCCIPFCRRTVARKGKFSDAEEMICGPHWRLVSRKIKRLRAAIRREQRLNRFAHRPDLDDWLWREAKRQAIERSAGITA